MPHTPYLLVKPDAPILHKTHCCGIFEIDYLSKAPTPLDVFKTIVYDLFKGAAGIGTPATDNYAARIVIFSGTVGDMYFTSHDGGRKDNYGQAFADFLTANDLGSVVVTPVVNNWTKNNIQMWAWTPNHKKLWKFLETNNITYLTPFARVEIIEEIEEEDDIIYGEDSED